MALRMSTGQLPRPDTSIRAGDMDMLQKWFNSFKATDNQGKLRSLPSEVFYEAAKVGRVDMCELLKSHRVFVPQFVYVFACMHNHPQVAEWYASLCLPLDEYTIHRAWVNAASKGALASLEYLRKNGGVTPTKHVLDMAIYEDQSDVVVWLKNAYPQLFEDDPAATIKYAPGRIIWPD